MWDSLIQQEHKVTQTNQGAICLDFKLFTTGTCGLGVTQLPTNTGLKIIYCTIGVGHKMLNICMVLICVFIRFMKDF